MNKVLFKCVYTVLILCLTFWSQFLERKKGSFMLLIRLGWCMNLDLYILLKYDFEILLLLFILCVSHFLINNFEKDTMYFVKIEGGGGLWYKVCTYCWNVFWEQNGGNLVLVTVYESLVWMRSLQHMVGSNGGLHVMLWFLWPTFVLEVCWLLVVHKDHAVNYSHADVIL